MDNVCTGMEKGIDWSCFVSSVMIFLLQRVFVCARVGNRIPPAGGLGTPALFQGNMPNDFFRMLNRFFLSLSF